MKKMLTVVGCLVLALSLALNPFPAKAAEKPVVAKIAEFSGATHPCSISTVRWANQMEKRTNGKFKGEVYLGEALGKVTTYTELVEKGGVNAARIINVYFPGRYPMLDASNLPFSWESSQAAAIAFYKLWPKGYFNKETASFKVLGLAMHSPYQIISTKAIPTIADAKGKRLRTGGGLWTKIIESWGAVPVQITTPDVYSSMERGLIDGAVIGLASADAFKYQEVAKYVTLLNMGTSSSLLVMNSNFYNNLPKDVQNVINGLFDEESKLGLSGKDFDDVEKEARVNWEKKGVKFLTPTGAEKEAWFQPARAVIEAWVQNTKKRGLDGENLVRDLDALAKAGK